MSLQNIQFEEKGADFTMKILNKTFGFFLVELKQISADFLESLPEDQVTPKLDLMTQQMDEIFEFLGEICKKIEQRLLDTDLDLSEVEGQNFIQFFEMDYMTKSQMYDNFIELTVIFIQLLKFVIKANLKNISDSKTPEIKYHQQAKNLFRIIERMSLLVASPRIYVLLLSLYVDENAPFFEKAALVSSVPDLFSQQ